MSVKTVTWHRSSNHTLQKWQFFVSRIRFSKLETLFYIILIFGLLKFHTPGYLFIYLVNQKQGEKKQEKKEITKIRQKNRSLQVEKKQVKSGNISVHFSLIFCYFFSICMVSYEYGFGRVSSGIPFILFVYRYDFFDLIVLNTGIPKEEEKFTRSYVYSVFIGVYIIYRY